jgi:hypothetical protein
MSNMIRPNNSAINLLFSQKKEAKEFVHVCSGFANELSRKGER